MLLGLLIGLPALAWSQSSPNCITATNENTITGSVFLNNGTTTDAFNTQARTNITLGQIVVGTNFGQEYIGGQGYWARFLLAPLPPVLTVTEGDLEDRIQLSWKPDPLGPNASDGFKIYRDGALLASVDGETTSFVDFNVIAGKFYTYEVQGINQFGAGNLSSIIGFLNPNGVVTGQVRSFSNNPVPGTIVSLTPTLGNAIHFDGVDDFAFAEYNAAFPTDAFTLSCWLKMEDGNDEAAIFDLGSEIGNNWWLHTLPAAAGKGIRFGVGKNIGDITTLEYVFPAEVADEWNHIAATYNGASLLLYFNGELIATTAASLNSSALPLFLGKKHSNTHYFKGYLDDFRMYNRQLPQTELQMFINRTVPGNADGLVAYWKFDESVGSKAFDQSALKTNMYFCGTTWSDDYPEIVNAGVTDETGYYEIAGINYGSGTTFTATPQKNFYFNQSLEFNAANESYAALTDFDLEDEASVSVTLKAFDFSTQQSILSKADAGGNNFFDLCLNAGNINLIIGNETHTFTNIDMGFYRITLTLEQVGGTLNVGFFLDGNAIGSYAYSGVPADWSGLPWTLGAKADGATGHQNYYTGLIDEAAFFNSILALPDIQVFTNIGTDPAFESLSSYFNLNEGSGTDLQDMGTALTGKGTAHNTAWSTLAAIEETLPHEFTPSSRLITLNTSNTSVDQIDFTDQSTIPVSGFVRFDGTACFEKEVEILVNGESHTPPIYTDENGKFSGDFEPGADIRLTPKFEDHSFIPAFWDLENLNAPVAGIIFRDQTVRKVYGQLAGGLCRSSIIPNDGSTLAKIKVRTLDGCYEQEITLPPGNGKFTIEGIPADSVTVALTEHSNPIIYDYFQNLGGYTLDLRMKNDTVDFIYFAPPVVEVSELPVDQTCMDETVLNMLASYQVNVKVFEDYYGNKCYLDTAALTFTNNIADLEPYDTLMTEGNLNYRFKAGGPNLVPPYLKTLQVTAEANDQQATEVLEAVVLGRVARETNFTSTTPEFPTLILRDPPGDASSAYMEVGETLCNTWGFESTIGGGVSTDITLSLGNNTTTSLGLGSEVEFEIEVTNDYTLKFESSFNYLLSNEMETCITATEIISTSDNDIIVGSEMGGDLYMGGALNIIYGITDELKFNPDECQFFIDPGLTIFPEKFNTTFIYSEYNILNEVVPALESLGTPESQASADRWRSIVSQNTQLKNQAIFEENISFDAGVVYEQSTSSEITNTLSHEWSVEFSAEFSNEFGVTVNGAGISQGYGIQLNTSTALNISDSESTSRTIGYTLSDDDIGDNFTVNIKKDGAYGTPVFELISGQSQCPNEPNTLKREGVSFSSDINQAVNVPMHDPAIFNLTLGNLSQSEETKTYTLESWQETNPDGAVIRFNGDLPPVGLEIPYGESVDVLMTVERGPLAFDYSGLTIAFFSDCEDERAEALGIDPPEAFLQTLEFDVSFIEPCSPVDIGFPLPGWVITPGNDNLTITLVEYDKDDVDLELIRVQYRRTQGDGAWINIEEVNKADLNEISTLVSWNTQGLQDGLYEIRAVTQCFGVENPGISSVIQGKIERSAPAIFGTPEPADGVLSASDEISITFNEPIRCDLIIPADLLSNNNIGLYDTQTGELIDAVISCNEDKITIVPNVPNQFIENHILRVEVEDIEDLVGNTFNGTNWEFFVDRNPLRWDVGAIVDTKLEEETKVVQRIITNAGGSTQAYTITDLPAWVEVYPADGILQPGEQQIVNFVFDNTMAIGVYTAIPLLDGALGSEPMEIDFRVLCPSPEWHVTPADFTYSMNLTLELDIEGDLSTDNQDIISAYVGNDIRGLAYVEYEPAIGKYLAFLTVYSDEVSGETIDFRIWDASECTLYGYTIESFPFVADDLIGSPLTPQTIHTDNLILRKIYIHPGWNWISYNLDLPDPAINTALISLSQPEGAKIKGQDAFSDYSTSLNSWAGTLNTLSVETMYQYQSTSDDSLFLVGAPIDPALHPIPILEGWNWIGYLPQQGLSVDDALSSLLPLNGDIVKGQAGFAQYITGIGWFGNLNFMSSPNGYKLKISNAGTLTYPSSFSGNEAALRNVDAKSRGNYWEVIPQQYEHSMNMIAVVSNEGQFLLDEGDEVGAFVSGQVRGSNKPIYIEAFDSYLLFLTLYANEEGEIIELKYYDASTGEVFVIAEQFTFVTNSILGTVDIPQQLHLQSIDTNVEQLTSSANFELFPNPASGTVYLSFWATEKQQVKLAITNVLGQVIEYITLDAHTGRNVLEWSVPANVANGLYNITLMGRQSSETQMLEIQR